MKRRPKSERKRRVHWQHYSAAHHSACGVRLRTNVLSTEIVNAVTCPECQGAFSGQLMTAREAPTLDRWD